MKKAHLVLCLGLVLAFGAACSPPWKIIRQANPNPFASGSFFISNISYENVRVGSGSEQDYLARKKPEQVQKWEGDKGNMNAEFRRGLQEKAGGAIPFESNKPNPTTFVIRPRVTFIEPGIYTPVFRKPAIIHMRVELLKNNRTLDVITMQITVPSQLIGPRVSVGGRLAEGAIKLGRWTTDYLKKRIAGK